MKKMIFIGTIFIMSFTCHAQMNNDESLEVLKALNEKQRKAVERLYRKWYSNPLHYLLTRSRRSSRIIGRWANSKASQKYIPRFIKEYSINVDEIAQPLSSFTTFNEFFTRKLKPNVRPLPADPTALISPADGSILVMQNIDENTLFPTKSVLFSTEKMLANAQLAALFNGGTAIIVRLAPWDYHRVHFPLSGVPSKPYIVAGRFESVSPEVFKAGIQPLEVNERHIIEYQTDAASTVAIVLVGALFVGAIIETYIPGQKYQQGDELGYFEYGGSTMVMLFQKDTITIAPEIVVDSAEGKETPVKMGQIIGHVIQKRQQLYR